MTTGSELSWSPFNFLSLPEDKAALDKSRVVLIPVPYDSTTSYRTGAREGPMAILKASAALEDYDHDLEFDVSEVGIHTSPFLEPHMGGPLPMITRVQEAVYSYASQGKVVGVLGGEHSITIGAVKAMSSLFPTLSVLYLDAHGDLRDQYMGTSWGHATVARRIQEVCPLVQVGVRSISQEERDFIRKTDIPTFFWNAEKPQVPDLSQLLPFLADYVYISVDLDVLDPSIMAAVGTPEPGGMSWGQISSLLRDISLKRNIVGFDVAELSPDEGPEACSYIAAKLAYKLIAYSTLFSKKESA